MYLISNKIEENFVPRFPGPLVTLLQSFCLQQQQRLWGCLFTGSRIDQNVFLQDRRIHPNVSRRKQLHHIQKDVGSKSCLVRQQGAGQKLAQHAVFLTCLCFKQ